MLREKRVSPPAGNRTPISRVTGEDTYHYTTEAVEKPFMRMSHTFYRERESTPKRAE